MKEAFAVWVTSSRARAIWTGIGLGFLTLPAMLFTAWLPGALVALLVFADRREWALETAFFSALPVVILVAMGGRLGGGIALGAMMVVPPLLMALLMRRSGSFNLSVQVATIVGVLLVPLIYVAVADPVGFWRPKLAELARLLNETGNADPAQVDFMMRSAERVLWGTVAWVIVLHGTLGTMIGLYWYGRTTGQAELGPRFRELRLGRVLAALAVVLFGLMYFGVAREADDMLLVLAGGFLMQGLALAHWARGAYGLGKWWLPVVYIGVIVVPPLLYAATVIGLTDNVIGIRDRHAARA